MKQVSLFMGNFRMVRMNYRKKVLALLLFCVLLMGIGYRVYHIFGYQDNVRSKAVFNQFYSLPDNILDAVWIGPSAVQEYIIPTKMYETNGIAVYPFSVGSMPFDSTEHMIKESEKTQNPQVYLVEIRALAFHELSETTIRRTADNMKFSKNRIDTINGMTSDLKEFFPDQEINLFDYYFSFTKYHSRWSELQRTDFAEDPSSYLGYWIDTSVTPFDKSEILRRYDAEQQPLPAENEAFLSRFLDFCDSFDKRIIFTCTPHCLDETVFGQCNYITSVIEERGYEVWNLNYEVDDIGLDYAIDFKNDAHTNVWGAQKVSAYAARVLADRFGFEDHRNDSRYTAFQLKAEALDKKIKEIELRQTTALDDYLSMLCEFGEGYNIYLGIRDIQGYAITEKETDRLADLGFEYTSELLEHEYHSYLGICKNGNKYFEAIGEGDNPSHFAGYIDDTYVQMDGKTWQGGNLCSIKLGVAERAKNYRGWNFVVENNQTGEVVDSVSFDTHVEEFTCYRE